MGIFNKKSNHHEDISISLKRLSKDIIGYINKQQKKINKLEVIKMEIDVQLSIARHEITIASETETKIYKILTEVSKEEQSSEHLPK